MGVLLCNSNNLGISGASSRSQKSSENPLGHPFPQSQAFHQAERVEPSGSKALAGVAFALQLQVESAGLGEI
jgi:hypothetical protein